MILSHRHPMLFLFAVVVVLGIQAHNCEALSSRFHGSPLRSVSEGSGKSYRSTGSCGLQMRKQKAHDRRTRKMQRGDPELMKDMIAQSLETVTSSPMAGNSWQKKQVGMPIPQQKAPGGRGRSRKRSTLYTSLAFYHNKFLSLLTEEYRGEEKEVIDRLKASIDDPIGLEVAGFALFDLYPERRGNIFSDEVYRLYKSMDATTTYTQSAIISDDDTHEKKSNDAMNRLSLPPNHKFTINDVIMLTLQPGGSGDFFNVHSLPTSNLAITAEARVLGTGPTYIDVAINAGAFEAAFGPAPNNYGPSGRGDAGMRIRVDRFFSDVPYTRMVSALSQITAITDRKKASALDENTSSENENPHDRISMDNLLRDVIFATHAFSDPLSSFYEDKDVCDLQYLSNSIAKPPMGSSQKLAKKALSYIQSNSRIFRQLNNPQLNSIEAALTRRLTLIQGPPGSGKTTVASAIAFGFVYQCRSLSPHTKVLACAFSNVGADNLAESLVRLGLKVVRIGKASATSQNLWDYTLDSYINKDPDAVKAMQNAARATSQLSTISKKSKGNSSKAAGDQAIKDAATAAVKASIKACNVAATKALREADIIVSTSIGAADPRLLAACGIVTKQEEEVEMNGDKSTRKNTGLFGTNQDMASPRTVAPDGLPPLSLPFVIVDEACQSVEPATLVPVTSTNSCRSLVLLGDPCQLPPTVRSSSTSPLSVSLMERLAATLPPAPLSQKDDTPADIKYLDSLPVKQAKSILSRGEQQAAYRKRFNGSILLSIQYRMHPSISAFASSAFYDGLLATPSFLANMRPFPHVLKSMMPCADPSQGVRMIDVGGRCNEKQGTPTRYSKTVYGPKDDSAPSLADKTTFWNEIEAEKVVSLVKEILENAHSSDSTCPSTIGIVTPYNGQVQLIKSLLASDEKLQSISEEMRIPVEVNSVDGYQGRERDVIIFSTVRSNRQGNIGFLKDWRRMNVALTRARSALIVVGDLDTLVEGDKHWAAFGKWCQGVRCVVDETFDEDEELTH